MAQVVEHLPSKFKALSSNTRTEKKMYGGWEPRMSGFRIQALKYYSLSEFV
jgi:hypothetical protein